MSSAQSNPPANPRDFNPAASFRAVGLSLVVNALCPFLLYRYLEPRFAANSVLPLLYAMIFPVAGFLFGVARKRTMDGVALIVLFGLVFHLTVTAASPDIGTALLLRSFQGGVVGLFFLIATAAGRPIVLYIARQFVAAGAPERGARFDAAVAQDRARTFTIVTIVWGVVLVLMSGVHAVLSIEMPHDQFVLISPILGVVSDLLVLLWTVRYTMRRMSVYLGPR